MTSTTKAILERVQAFGHVVKVFRINDTVELHAVPLNGDAPQVCRCNDGDGDDEEYCAVCLLAQAVGIELEDG